MLRAVRREKEKATDLPRRLLAFSDMAKLARPGRKRSAQQRSAAVVERCCDSRMRGGVETRGRARTFSAVMSARSSAGAKITGHRAPASQLSARLYYPLRAIRNTQRTRPRPPFYPPRIASVRGDPVVQVRARIRVFVPRAKGVRFAIALASLVRRSSVARPVCFQFSCLFVFDAPTRGRSHYSIITIRGDCGTSGQRRNVTHVLSSRLEAAPRLHSRARREKLRISCVFRKNKKTKKKQKNTRSAKSVE